MVRRVLTVAILTLLAGLGKAQSRPEFEVASVRMVDNSTLGDSINMNIGTVRGERVTFGNATLRDVIRWAYDMPSDAQIVGPDWIRSKQLLYEIDARSVPGATHQEQEVMLQSLLAERFKLVTHHEQKVMSHFALLPAKNGPKLKSVAEKPPEYKGITWGGRIESILTMPSLAYLLSRFETERPIIDETGLKGLYEIKLNWALQQTQHADETQGPSLFTALDEQLGLKLELRKGPVDVLVVESVEKVPTEN
jgi:uncharacterized protein (TIGR03435 family)